jgi:transposase-like protein
MMENVSPPTEQSCALVSPSKPTPKRRSLAERRRMVEASLAAGATVPKVAARYGIHPTHLYWLRKQYREGRLETSVPGTAKLLAVQVVKGGRAGTGSPATAPAKAAGCIELELARGQMRVSGTVDAQALRLVLECLR